MQIDLNYSVVNLLTELYCDFVQHKTASSEILFIFRISYFHSIYITKTLSMIMEKFLKKLIRKVFVYGIME